MTKKTVYPESPGEPDIINGLYDCDLRALAMQYFAGYYHKEGLLCLAEWFRSEEAFKITMKTIGLQG